MIFRWGIVSQKENILYITRPIRPIRRRWECSLYHTCWSQLKFRVIYWWHEICYKRNHYDPFLIDETRDHNPGPPSNPGFCFWHWFGRWSADRTHSVKCVGFIDGVNVGISIVCAVFTVIKSKISLCRTDCSNKEALSYEIEKPKECSWSSNNLEPSLAPLQTLDQIRLERLRIDVLFREYLVNFLNNISPNMLTLHLF